MHLKQITHSAFLLFFALLVIFISMMNGAVSAEPAQTDLVQELQVQPANTNQAAAASNSSTKMVTFDKYPDGAAIIVDTILQGDEFESEGIILSGAPVGSYCQEATSAGIMTPPHSVGLPSINFLTTTEPTDFRCHGVPVKILFVKPVNEVHLTFYGASKEYTMKAYDQADNLLGKVDQDAVCCSDPFEISYSSIGYDIKYITFGSPSAITAVEKAAYTPKPTIYLPIIIK